MSCATGKREFTSSREAKRALRSIDRPHGRMHTYRCDQDPGHWHIGHSSLLAGGLQEYKPAPGYRRPADVHTGFIMVGAHQVVYGSVCIDMGAVPTDPNCPTLSGLRLPDDLLGEVWDTSDQRVIDTLLAATPDQLDQIKHAWARQRGTTGGHQ